MGRSSLPGWARTRPQGATDRFTGAVSVDSPFKGSDPARIAGGAVTFAPGARTAWHSHPLGQTLIVIRGAGLVRSWGGEVQEIRPGDVVWIKPSVKHRHGASPTIVMTHMAITEVLDGKETDWLEKVSDEQYRGR